MKYILISFIIFLIYSYSLGCDKSIKERNILKVWIKANDLYINYEKKKIDDLCNIAYEFFLNPKEKYIYSERFIIEAEEIGLVKISKGIISLQTDRNVLYKDYIAVQNELQKGINLIRENQSQKFFKKSYKDLPAHQKKILNYLYPDAISEAEPNYIYKNGEIIKNDFSYLEFW